MHTLVQLVVSGMAAGIIYGSLGLAFVLIFQATRTLNLAQGELATLGAFSTWSLLKAGLPYWAAFAAIVVLSLLSGFVIHRVFVQPLERRARSSLLVLTLALLIGINGLNLYIWGGDLKAFPSPFNQTPYNIAGVFLNRHDLGTLGVLLVAILLVYVLFEYTNLGLAMRATAQNRASAELVGISTDLLLGIGWGLAAALGSIAGIMAAPVAFLEPQMMLNILPYALAAITLGGLSSPAGAIVGGILVGVFENLLGNYARFVGDDLKLPVVLALMAIVLLVRPQGLFGRAEVTRV